MADRKPPGEHENLKVPMEHEFSVDLERFSTDYSLNFVDDPEYQKHGSTSGAAAKTNGQSPETGFEMIAMGSPVMSKWRWIGEKELQYLVTNRRTPPAPSTTELPLSEPESSSSVTEGEPLGKGAFVRVVTEGAGETSLDVGSEGVKQPPRIAHILLPTAASPDERPPSNAIKGDSSPARREKEPAVGKKRKVSSVILEESLAVDLEKGMRNSTIVTPPPPSDFDEGEEEPVCRICHGTSASPLKSDVIELGCACKFDLGHAHNDCAETWFRVRGNRQCEICGETAQNVLLVEPINASPGSSLDTTITVVTVHPPTACWQNRPIRNFLLIFLVTAFLVPWLFRFAYYQFSAK